MPHRWRKSLWLALAMLGGTGEAAATLHININAVGGVQQTVRINQRLPQPFVAKVTFDNGLPAAGVDLLFSVNACASVPELPPGTQPCPDPAVYGHFLNNTPVTTGLDGTATSPPFVAGKLQGTYSVYVSQLNWSQTINGQTISYIPMSPSTSNLFQIAQVVQAIDPTPLLSPGGALALIVLLGFAEYVERRRSRSR